MDYKFHLNMKSLIKQDVLDEDVIPIYNVMLQSRNQNEHHVIKATQLST